MFSLSQARVTSFYCTYLDGHIFLICLYLTLIMPLTDSYCLIVCEPPNSVSCLGAVRNLK